MKDRKKVIKMVMIIVVLCGLFIMASIIAYRCTQINSGNSAKRTIIDLNNLPEDDPSIESIISVEYETEKYETKNDEGEIVCVVERNIPTVENQAFTKGAKNIQNTLRSIMDDMWDTNLKSNSDDSKERGNPAKRFGVKYFANLEYQTPDIVTFSIKMDGNFGYDSWNSYELYTFDKRTGVNLTIDSGSNNPEEMKQTILDLTKTTLKEKGITVTVPENETEDLVITNNMDRQGHFGILADGIHVNYQKYELTSDNDNVIEVVLGLDRANSLLKDEYKIQ